VRVRCPICDYMFVLVLVWVCIPVLESCEKLNIADTTLPPVISIGVLLVLVFFAFVSHFFAFQMMLTNASFPAFASLRMSFGSHHSCILYRDKTVIDVFGLIEHAQCSNISTLGLMYCSHIHSFKVLLCGCAQCSRCPLCARTPWKTLLSMDVFELVSTCVFCLRLFVRVFCVCIFSQLSQNLVRIDWTYHGD
jgi:hypothetical protein